jgi:polysaccharide deacetylase 2 family uncharacterized protein YibQ
MATKNKPKTTKSKPKNSTKKPTTSTTKKKPSTKKSTPKKKQPTKRKSTKKRTSKKNASKEKFFKIASIIFGMIILVALGYFWGHNDVAKSEEHRAKSVMKPKAESVKLKAKGAKNIELRAKSEMKYKAKSTKPKAKGAKSEMKPKAQSVKPKAKSEKKPKNTQSSTLKTQPSKLNPQNSSLTPQPSERYLHSSTLPKLVIIIDDVHTKAQLDAIKSTHLDITPSIFPPYQRTWNTPKLVKHLKHYMVHLPMESSSAKFNRQTKTILTSWSQSQIDNRIKAIREMFPNAKYINNHTGSVLTANYHSMDMLYKALIDYGFVFVDSYTTSNSKVAKIAKKYNTKYLKRDVFIDNVQNVAYIKKQIKKGIKIAKRRGYAIIIGHPHKATLQALKSSSKLLDSVEVVYMDELIK